MDQAAPENKNIFWFIRECGEASDMDRHLCLCTDSHHQKATKTGNRPLHNFTDIEPDLVRESAIGSTAYAF